MDSEIVLSGDRYTKSYIIAYAQGCSRVGGVTRLSGFCSGYRRRFLLAGLYYSCTPSLFRGKPRKLYELRCGKSRGRSTKAEIATWELPADLRLLPACAFGCNTTLLWGRHRNRTSMHTAHTSNGAVGDGTLTLPSSSLSCGGKHLFAVLFDPMWRQVPLCYIRSWAVSHRAHRATGKGTSRSSLCMKFCTVSVCAAHPDSLRRARDSRPGCMRSRRGAAIPAFRA